MKDLKLRAINHRLRAHGEHIRELLDCIEGYNEHDEMYSRFSMFDLDQSHKTITRRSVGYYNAGNVFRIVTDLELNTNKVFWDDASCHILSFYSNGAFSMCDDCTFYHHSDIFNRCPIWQDQFKDLDMRTLAA